MAEEKGAIAIIPGESFRWRARVQFIESFQTRAAALNYAFQHGYNLIVERNEGSSAIFDVMKDPHGACTAGLNLELLKTEDALVEPPPVRWTALMLSTVWDFARRLATFVAGLSAREIVPLSRRAAAVAGTYLRKIAPASRRAADASASLYRREIVPTLRRAAAVASMYLREIASISRRTAAFASMYLREIAPFLRIAAAKCWSDSKMVSRRHRWAVAAPNHSDQSRLR